MQINQTKYGMLVAKFSYHFLISGTGVLGQQTLKNLVLKKKLALHLVVVFG